MKATANHIDAHPAAPPKRRLRRRGDAPKRKTVFVSGHFNVLHPGHVRLLRFAKECGDHSWWPSKATASPASRPTFRNSCGWKGIQSNVLGRRSLPARRAGGGPDRSSQARCGGQRQGTRAAFQSGIDGGGTVRRKTAFQFGCHALFVGGPHPPRILRIRPALDHEPKELSRTPWYFGGRAPPIYCAASPIAGSASSAISSSMSTSPASRWACRRKTRPSWSRPSIPRRFIGGAGIVAAHAAGLGASVRFRLRDGRGRRPRVCPGATGNRTVSPPTCSSTKRGPPPASSAFAARVRRCCASATCIRRRYPFALQNQLLEHLALIMEDTELLVFADFNYGCLPQPLVDRIVDMASGRRRDTGGGQPVVFADRRHLPFPRHGLC
jgi:hypothetical protein